MSYKIIYFDGECVLCNRFADLVIRYDKSDVFRLALLQHHELNFISHMQNSDIPDSVILKDGDKVYFRSEAALRIMRELTYPWKALWVFRLLPHRFRDACYSWIAKRRYRLFGRRDDCRVPSPEEIKKFM